MPRTPAPRLLVLALGLSVLTACGSTVQQAAEVSAGGALGQQATGLTADGPPVAGGASGGIPAADGGGLAGGGTRGAGTASGPTGPTAARGQAAGTPGTGAQGGPSVAAPAAGPVPEKGRGWDRDFVYLGVTTQKDVQAAADSVGAKGLDAGDQEAQALAVAAAVNAQGGLFGRKVKVLFRDQQMVATAQDPNTAGAAACTYFTQDHPVIALLNPVTLMDVPSFRACMAKAKVPLFSASVAAVDSKVGQSLAPYFYQSVAPSWNALAPALVSRLKAQGWLTGWNVTTGSPGPAPVKVGILTDTTDVDQRVGDVLVAAWRAVGQQAEVFAAHGSYGSAVLKFSGDGVTHVIASDASLVGFQLSAASQGYRPRYGITSLNAPVTLLQANSPKGQNHGAVGVGWAPSLDVDDAHDRVRTSGEADCSTIFARAEQDFSGKRLAEAVAFAFCDGIRLIVSGARQGGGFSGAQIYAGVQRSASSLKPAFAFGMGIGPSTLFLPGAVRDLRWDDACECAQYAGSTQTPLVRR